MKNLMIAAGAVALLAACATPTTTLQNPQTGHSVTCGIKYKENGVPKGYSVEKPPERRCTEYYIEQGYDIVSHSQ